MLTAKKISLLRVAKERLGLADENYRSLLMAYGGAASARDLDERGFAMVMDRFRSLGFTSDARKRTFGDRHDMASPAQVDHIRTLWAEVATNPTEAHLGAWLERFGVSALRFLDAATAPKVIAALKAWRSRLDSAPRASAP